MTVDNGGKITDVRCMVSAQTILAIADAYASATDVPLVTVSSRVFSDSKKLAAISDGADLTLKRYTSALQWFSDHWPENTAWPEGIDRPERSELVA